MTTAAAPAPLITIGDLRAAADILRGVAVRTPLLPDDALSERLGAPIFYKSSINIFTIIYDSNTIL